MSIIVNLQDNRPVFRIFITLLRFSFDSPSYFVCYVGQNDRCNEPLGVIVLDSGKGHKWDKQECQGC